MARWRQKLAACLYQVDRWRVGEGAANAYFREFQPPTLVVWGKNDPIFPAEGAYPYQRDLNNVQLHLLDTGHFALEEDGRFIASLMRDFLAKHIATRQTNVVAR